MKRSGSLFGNWTRDQVVLILGPILLSLLLVGLYAGGLRPVGWPTLLFVVVLINLAGDVAFAVKSERQVRSGRVSLRNDMVGRRTVAEDDFAGVGGAFEGRVRVAGERWRSVSDHPVAAGDTLRVTGRRGLVLHVVRDST